MEKKIPIIQATFYNNNTKQTEDCYPLASSQGVVFPDGRSLDEHLENKADDADVVHKTGDETIEGYKDFHYLTANSLGLYDEEDHNHWLSAHHSHRDSMPPLVQLGNEDDWSVILRGIAEPEGGNDAANKSYVDRIIAETCKRQIQISEKRVVVHRAVPVQYLEPGTDYYCSSDMGKIGFTLRIRLYSPDSSTGRSKLNVPIPATIAQAFGLIEGIDLYLNGQSVAVIDSESFDVYGNIISVKGLAVGQCLTHSQLCGLFHYDGTTASLTQPKHFHSDTTSPNFIIRDNKVLCIKQYTKLDEFGYYKDKSTASRAIYRWTNRIKYRMSNGEIVEVLSRRKGWQQKIRNTQRSRNVRKIRIYAKSRGKKSIYYVDALWKGNKLLPIK